MKQFVVGAAALGAAALAVAPVVADDHPFKLVNVIDLFEVVAFPPGGAIDDSFDPTLGPPPNLAVYRATPRIGTNPSAVATDGVRAWVGGFWNGATYIGAGTVEQQRSTWYASVGIAEVLNIETTSGFGNPYVRYVDTYQFGPQLSNGDWISGLSYDDVTKTLYATFDETGDFDPFFMPPGSDPQAPSHVAAIDADPMSGTYGQHRSGWPVNEPPSGVATPATLTRFHAGVAVDPLDPTRIFTMTQGSGRLYSYDVNAPGGPVNNIVVFQCGSSSYRRFDLDPVTGDFYYRTENGIQKIFRNLAGGATPFAAASLASFVGWNNFATCADANGFGKGNAQGQGIAFVSAVNLADASDDLVLANSRPATGSNHAYDLRFFRASDGATVAPLELPCEPSASPTTGNRIIDFDYHSPSGTLAVVSFESRKLYIYKANLAAPPPATPVYRDFDFTRNGRVSLADFAGLQTCYTGSENVGGLSLNCQRMNSDLDCDIDFVDFQAFVDVYDIAGGP